MKKYIKVFIDTAPFIYYFNNDPKFGIKSKEIISELILSGTSVATTVLTYEEFFVHPVRNSDMIKIEAFNEFIEDAGIEICIIDKEIAIKAAQIRAIHKNIKSIDALQLAAALTMGCDTFLSNDKTLKNVKGINCVTLDEMLDN